MSVDKQTHEAGRWLETAEEDLEAARVLLREGKYSHACLLAQQSGEKAVKALWHFIGEDPWGHSIHKLILNLPEGTAKKKMAQIQDEAAMLDRFYIPSRYPNGLPDLTPGKYYFQKDAEFSIRVAESILGTFWGHVFMRFMNSGCRFACTCFCFYGYKASATISPLRVTRSFRKSPSLTIYLKFLERKL